MAYTAIQDPKITILDLLDPDNGGSWNNANTSIGYDPAFHTGWKSADADKPEVTVSLNEGEGPIGGGDTGYSFMTGDGSGPGADWSGVVRVECFSDRDVESSVNPKQLTWEFAEEVTRIVLANQLTATDLRLIAPFQRVESEPDSDSDPAEFHYTQPVGYIREVSP